MNLAEWLSRAPRSAGQEQLTLVTALALAIEEGHRAGRQFAGWSPSRIVIRGEGLDLSALEAARRPTEDDAYTAPEVADGGAHSKRSDVFSAGVILYEILTGTHPFGGLGVQQQRSAPRPLKELRPDLSQDLADGVTACLDRDPEWRSPDLSYVLQVARGLRAKGPTSARQGLGPAFGASSRSSVSRLSLVLVGVAVAVIAGAAAYWELRGSRPGPSGSGQSAPAKPEPQTPVTTSPVTAPTLPVAVASPPAAAREAAPTPSPVPVATPASTTLPIAPASSAPEPSPVAATAAPPALRPTVAPVPASTLAAAPTPPPVATPAPAVVPSSTPGSLPLAEPAVLRSVTPLKIRRGLKGLLDVRGDNLRAEDQVTIAKQKGRGDPSDVLLLRKKFVDSTLLQVLVNVAPNAATGLYSLAVVDGQGRASNALTFEVTQ